MPILQSSDPKTDKWTKLADVPKDQHSYVADNLKEGEEYQFRVMSKNEVGSSNPLESDPVTPLSLNQAPKVDPEVPAVACLNCFKEMISFRKQK